MTPEFKAKWIKALRSGEYKQARGVLKDCNGGMCCLGVAADLLDPTKWGKEATHCESGRGFGWNGAGTSSVGSVARAIGILIPDAQALAHMNDGEEGEPLTFEQIAAHIEATL